MNEHTARTLRELVETGKRMRALQQNYFKTRRMDTLRDAMKLERAFDKLLEETEKILDGR